MRSRFNEVPAQERCGDDSIGRRRDDSRVEDVAGMTFF